MNPSFQKGLCQQFKVLLLLGLPSVFASCSSRSQLFKASELDAEGSRSLGGATSTSPENDAGECESPEDCSSENLCEIFSCTDGECKLEGETECVIDAPCLQVACEPASGACVVSSITDDLDGDGYFAPLPGFAPGEEGSCGNDCDDTSAAANPNGIEECDGVDNDCDGSIDNGASYLETSSFSNATQVGGGRFRSSSMRSVIFADEQFYLGYWGKETDKFSYFEARNPDADPVLPATDISLVNASSFGPDLASTGQSFGGVWADAREDNNYEIYFARFSLSGEKLAADIRVSNGAGFSVHPDIEFSQGQFYIVYDDRRFSFDDPAVGAQLIGRVIDSTGELLSSEIRLTDNTTSVEQPEIAVNAKRIGMVANEFADGESRIIFRSFDKNFANPTPPRVLSLAGGYRASIATLGDDFLVVWDTYTVPTGPGPVIMGALINDQGDFIEPPRSLTSGASYARSHALLSLGDRAILSWGDGLAGNYEIYALGLDATLAINEPLTRITYSAADTLGPYMALGRNGRIGLGFDDWSGGERQGYFMTMGCNQPSETFDP